MSSTSNTIVTPPPLYTSISDPNGVVNTPWARWFEQFYYLIGNPSFQVVTGATTLDEDAVYTSLATSVGTYAITLSAPTIPGRTKIIEMITRTSTYNVTLSLTNITGGTSSTTCTWNGTNQQLILISGSTKWIVIKQNGVTLS